MYVKEKMIPVETIPGLMEGGYRTMMEGVNSIIIYLTYYNKFYEHHN
jgi:hypothetical protein